ncbi:hypothetical protein JVU11DRAFT_7413 [Chiua virens]|nr:hypothetical protein JVU11DRAFT_7413 [Chiua virens]
MTKLRLKRTPAEELERAQRKAHKAAKKAAKRKRKEGGYDSLDDTAAGPSTGKKKHAAAAFSDGSHNPDYDAIRAELEEMQFREKMWGALEDDERLGGIDSRFNGYSHIPDRWAPDKHDSADPQYMGDDEYAEWIREGMWKKKHAREYEEQAKRDAEKAARRAREKEIKAQTSRLERLALEQEDIRRKERQRQREEEYRQRYEQRWKALLDNRTKDHGPLTFKDIPWPLFPAQLSKQRVSDSSLKMEEISSEAVAAFLLPDSGDNATSVKNRDVSRRKRDKIKETLLRYHPDKFEGRLMNRVPESDRENVREAVGQVARVLNVLMSEQS